MILCAPLYLSSFFSRGPLPLPLSLSLSLVIRPAFVLRSPASPVSLACPPAPPPVALPARVPKYIRGLFARLLPPPIDYLLELLAARRTLLAFFLFSSLLFFCLCVFTAFEIGPRSSSIPVCLFVFVRSLWSFSYREGIYCTPFCQEKKYVVSELPMFRPTGLLLRRLRGDTVTERRCLLKGQCRNYTTLCQRSVLSLKMNEEGTCLSIM